MELGLLICFLITTITLSSTAERKFILVDGGNKLKCVNCGIEVFQTNTFNLPDNDLRELDVSNSKVHTIKPFAFRNLKNLEYILLDHNNISSIHRDAFAGLPMVLSELSLAYNKLSNLTDGFLNGLGASIITLNHNQLVQVPNGVFKGLYGAMILDLSYNSISTLYSDSLNYLKNLEALYLQGNELSLLPIGVFKHTRCLKTLNLAYNKFSFLHFSVFSPLSNLTHLNISHNQLRTFFPNILLSLWKIELLDISDNGLQDVDVKSVKIIMPTLHWLVINDNFWSCAKLGKVITDSKGSEMDVTSYSMHKYDIVNINGIACLDTPHPFDKNTTLKIYFDQIKRDSNYY